MRTYLRSFVVFSWSTTFCLAMLFISFMILRTMLNIVGFNYFAILITTFGIFIVSLTKNIHNPHYNMFSLQIFIDGIITIIIFSITVSILIGIGIHLFSDLFCYAMLYLNIKPLYIVEPGSIFYIINIPELDLTTPTSFYYSLRARIDYCAHHKLPNGRGGISITLRELGITPNSQAHSILLSIFPPIVNGPHNFNTGLRNNPRETVIWSSSTSRGSCGNRVLDAIRANADINR